jgi:hypothetical protein
MNKFAIVAPVGLLVVASSFGQELKPFTVRVGYDYLTNSNASDATKQSGYTVGIGYDFYHIKSMHAKLSLDVDFSDHAGNGNKIETGSALIVARAPFSPGGMSKGPDFYYGIGAGVVRTFVGASSTQTINTGSSTTTTTSNTSSLAYVGGGEILLGCRFTKDLSAELYWRVHSNNSGVDTDSAGIVVGFHF